MEDRQQAAKKLEGLVALVNRIWERRAETLPSFETRQRPTPMAVYKLLPGTNCKGCGEPTCFTFALKLAASQRGLDDCPTLQEPPHAEKRDRLRAILIDAPSIG
jgi:ArsR family metal-binding transcriptional regulator